MQYFSVYSSNHQKSIQLLSEKPAWFCPSKALGRELSRNMLVSAKHHLLSCDTETLMMLLFYCVVILDDTDLVLL